MRAVQAFNVILLTVVLAGYLHIKAELREIDRRIDEVGKRVDEVERQLREQESKIRELEAWKRAHEGGES